MIWGLCSVSDQNEFDEGAICIVTNSSIDKLSYKCYISRSQMVALYETNIALQCGMHVRLKKYRSLL